MRFHPEIYTHTTPHQYTHDDIIYTFIITYTQPDNAQAASYHQPSSEQYVQPQATHAFQAAAAAEPIVLTHGLIMEPPQQQYTNTINQQQQYSQQQQERQGTPAGQYPGFITQLRKEAPITQKSPPVFASQPAAASFRGKTFA